MTPINLWVDDVRPPLIGWVHAHDVAEAQGYLAAGVVMRASLDHDLGACADCTAAGTHIGDMRTPETTFVSWCPHVADGTALCLWMAETGHWPREKPTVHSMNPEGARRMRGIIDRYFGTKQGESYERGQSQQE